MLGRSVFFGVVLMLILGGIAFYVAAGAQTAPAPQIQTASPVDELRVHLVGVHVIKEAPDRQYVAHHYCQQLNPDTIQCAVFDSDQPGARLMDVEYVISDALYRSLSADEQLYWHPHDYEVDHSLLQAPELPPDEANALLSTIRGTHGKTWHLWAAKDNPLPLGEPDLAWSITAPGQLLPDVEMQLKEDLQ